MSFETLKLIFFEKNTFSRVKSDEDSEFLVELRFQWLRSPIFLRAVIIIATPALEYLPFGQILLRIRNRKKMRKRKLSKGCMMLFFGKPVPNYN